MITVPEVIVYNNTLKIIMMDRSNIKTFKSSTDEHQTLSREQIELAHPLLRRYSQKQPKHRSQADSMELRSYPDPLPLSPARPEQDQLIARLKVRVNELEGELVDEKKKNSKLRKIISSKMLKEKELEEAYRGIAIELKRQISCNNVCFCKNKSIALQSSKEPELEEPLPLNFKAIQQQNIQLKQECQALKKQCQRLLSELNQPDDQNQLMMEVDQLKTTNRFYLNQIEKHKQEKQALTEQLQKVDLLYSQKQMSKNMENREEGEKPLRSSLLENDHNRSAEIQEHMKKTELIQMSMPQQGRKKEIDAENDDETSKLFKSFEVKEDSIVEEKEKEHESSLEKEEEVEKEEKIEKMQDLPDQLSFQTVTENSRLSSFYSIRYSQIQKQLPNNQEKRGNIPDFEDMSSVCLQKMLQNSVLHGSIDDLKNFCEDGSHEASPPQPFSIVNREEEKGLEISDASDEKVQEQPQKSCVSHNSESCCKCIHTLYCFIKKVNQKINAYGSKYHISVDFPEIYQLAERVQSRKLISSHSDFSLWVSHERIEEIGEHLMAEFEKVERQIKKGYKKEQNNLNLELHELTHKLDEMREEKGKRDKKIDALLQYNKKLQYELSEASNSSQQESPSHKNILLHQIYRSKINIVDNQIDNAQVQCSLIEATQYDAYEKFISSLVDIANSVLVEKLGMSISGEVYLFGDLQGEFRKIIEKIINQVQQSCQNRKKSFSYLSVKSEQMAHQDPSNLQPKKTSLHENHSPPAEHKEEEAAQIDEEQFYQMSAEIQQLKRTIKEKDEHIFMLKEKIALQKYQIQRLKSFELDFRKKDKVGGPFPEKSEEKKSELQQKVSNGASSSSKRQFASEYEPEFLECSQIREYNNLNAEKDEEIKSLKQKLQVLQREMQNNRSRPGQKRNKVIYINY